MNYRLVLTFAAACVIAWPAGAQTLYRCPDASGTTTLQDVPCSGGSTVTVRPARPSATDQEMARLRAQTDASRLRLAEAKREREELQEQMARDRRSIARSRACIEASRTIIRERAWLASPSLVTRQAAADQIAAAESTVKTFDCNRGW